MSANGIDIHVVEAGAGEPLLMLENGMISTSPIWAERGDWLSSYVHHIDTLAEYFRVIVPDFRGSGRTVHPGGPISYDLLADRMRRAEDAREHRGTREKTCVVSIPALRSRRSRLLRRTRHLRRAKTTITMITMTTTVPMPIYMGNSSHCAVKARLELPRARRRKPLRAPPRRPRPVRPR
jgi:hypothetical protein